MKPVRRKSAKTIEAHAAQVEKEIAEAEEAASRYSAPDWRLDLTLLAEAIDEDEALPAWLREAQHHAASQDRCCDLIENLVGKLTCESERDSIRRDAENFVDLILAAGCRDLHATRLMSPSARNEYFDALDEHLRKHTLHRLDGRKATAIDLQAPPPFNLPKCPPENRNKRIVIREINLCLDAASRLLLRLGKTDFHKFICTCARRLNATDKKFIDHILLRLFERFSNPSQMTLESIRQFMLNCGEPRLVAFSPELIKTRREDLKRRWKRHRENADISTP